MKDESQQILLRTVKENYEETAEEFSQTRKKYLWPELARLAEEVKDGEKILDVGCGSGRLLLALDDKKIEYVGIDSSTKLISIAEKQFGKPGRFFFIGDILFLEAVPVLSNKYFDKIFSIAVLHHIPGENLRIKALRQMAEKLPDNGEIIITVWNMWNQWRYQKLIIKSYFTSLTGLNPFAPRDLIFEGWGKDKQTKRYYHAFTANELKRIALKANLHIKKLYNDDRNYYMILKKHDN